MVVFGLGHVLGVAFTLIPDRAAHAVGHEGVDHGVENMAGVLVSEGGGFGDDGGIDSLHCALHDVVGADPGLVSGEFYLERGEGLSFGVVAAFDRADGGGVVGLAMSDGAGVVLLDCPGHPAFDGGAGKGALDDADGNAEFLLKFLAEVVGDGRGFGGGFGIAAFPLGEAVTIFVEWFVPVFAGGTKEAEVGQIDVGLAFGFKGVADGPTHVGLAEGDPDFADGDVVDGDGVLARDGQGVAGAGRGGLKEELPFTLGVGGDGVPHAPTGLDGDVLAGGSEPPDGVAGLLLQDHVIAKEVGEPNFGVGGEPGDEGGDEGEGVFHARERGRIGRVVGIPRGGKK